MTDSTKTAASPKRRFALWQGAAALSTLALVPLATGAMASVDSKTQEEIARFMDVYLEVKSNYVEPVEDSKLIEGAINGMLASLDPHSGYLDARGFSNLRTQTDGEYGGLGLSVTMEDGVVKVIAPTADTPADKAGIKAGDYITHINKELIFGMTLDEAVEQMRGRPGTPIDITIVREGQDKPLEMTLTREIIDLKPVKWEVSGDVGVLTVTNFSADATADLKAAMMAVEKSLGKTPRGWILDLRSNPGGLLDEAVGISDLFLERGEIVSQRGRKKGDIERYFAEPGDAAGGAPVIVLIDSGSASASEIVAGALQSVPIPCRSCVRPSRPRAAGPASRGRDGRTQLRQGIGADGAAADRHHRASPDHCTLLHAIGPQRAGRRDRPRHPGAAAQRPRLRLAAQIPRKRPAPSPDQREEGRRRSARKG